jgi:hypothetical protein
MNNEWKPEKNITSPWDVDVRENNIGEPVKSDWYQTKFPDYQLTIPKQSNWSCYMFGNRPGGSGIVYTPQEGKVPNRFVRFMMYLCFDCKWVKKDT